MISKNTKITSAFFLAIVLLLIFSFVTGVHAQTATTSASPSALPSTGVSLPTLFGIVVGAVAIILSLALAL